MATKARAKASKATEVEDDELELEDLDEDVEETETSAKSKKGSSKAQSEVTFGVADLAAHLSELTGKTVTGRELRAQIRRMVRDNSGRVERDISPQNRTRYDWPAKLKDPEVKAIIKAYMDGEPEVAKKKALDELKERGAKKKAEKAKKRAKEEKAKAKAAVEEADDEDDDFEVEDDDE
jgi:hypothetical protein